MRELKKRRDSGVELPWTPREIESTGVVRKERPEETAMKQTLL
jgi:hypothetical protein